MTRTLAIAVRKRFRALVCIVVLRTTIVAFSPTRVRSICHWCGLLSLLVGIRLEFKRSLLVDVWFDLASLSLLASSSRRAISTSWSKETSNFRSNGFLRLLFKT